MLVGLTLLCCIEQSGLTSVALMPQSTIPSGCRIALLSFRAAVRILQAELTRRANCLFSLLKSSRRRELARFLQGINLLEAFLPEDE